MSKLLDKLHSVRLSLNGIFTLGVCETNLYQYFLKFIRSASPAQPVVLVQCVEDVFYYGLFGQIITSLRERKEVHVDQYVSRSLNVGESASIWAFLKSKLIVNVLYNHKWARLYRAYCDDIGFRNSAITPVSDVLDFYYAWKVWKKCTDKTALINLEIDGVVVGDLVNDSFLRFKPAPTVKLNDIYLLILLWQAYRTIRRAKVYFQNVSPVLYLTSYSTYIQHGIPVRVALQFGTRVFAFGNYQEFAKELKLEDDVHTKNPDAYADEFAACNDQMGKLAVAEMAMSARMSGAIDGATAYMKKSAYAESGEKVPDVRGAVVVFLHDFYDSPHVYRNMVFPDFWEWICFTIDTLQCANIPFFIKPHPNQINLSNGVLDELKDLYPSVPILSSSITNKQLSEAGMLCAVTVYGTVAHEMAYLGVPTIASAHHPHISFEFCKTAKTKEEYATLLQECTKLSVDKVSMREQSLAFYYMHNLSLSENAKLLRDKVMEFRVVCDDCLAHDLAGDLAQLTQIEGYAEFIALLENCVEVKATCH
jgi:hypothetical protein